MSRRPREFAGSPPLYSSPVPPHHLILPVVSPSCVCVSTRIITLCLITQTTPYGQWECRIDRHVDKCGGTVRCYLLCSLVTTLLTTFLAGGEAMTKRFSIFWGCTIPARFPFVEKSTRVMLDDLGATVEEVDGFTCCPEGTLVKAVDEDAYYLTAARNLALAEKEQRPLVTPCNGCYSTFKSVEAELRTDWRRKKQVNETLETEDLTLGAGPEVKHLVEWVFDEIAPGRIARRLRDQVGVLRGCLDRVGQRESALEFCARKVEDLSGREVDALVVACPSCFQQFDLNQAALLRRRQKEGAGEDVGIPVLYYSELVALAMGRDPEDLGLYLHRVDVSPFLKKWGRRLEQKEELGRAFRVPELQKCNECRACENDCPVTKSDPSFSPTAIIGEILSGDLEEVLERGELWKCLECFTCYEMCHSRLGMAEVFRRLKELAVERGHVPEAVESAYETFLTTGKLGEPRESVRRRLGLDAPADMGFEELKRLLQRRDG